jgi:hypothetical protein
MLQRINREKTDHEKKVLVYRNGTDPGTVRLFMQLVRRGRVCGILFLC